MSGRRTDMHRLQELVRLHRMGTKVREVARLLKMSPNTERLYREALEAAELLQGDPVELPELSILRAAIDKGRPSKKGVQEQSSASLWVTKIEAMMRVGAGPKSIYDTLKREETGFTASRWAVKRLCRRLKKERGVQAQDVAIPVRTKPGVETQVDFGFIGMLFDPVCGRQRKAWVFVMTLGYSRHQYCQVVFDQSTPTWLRLHCDAFKALGCVPEVVRPDNLKAAVIRAAFGAGDTPALNRSYRELARHFGFKIEPTPAFQPKKKGKVERGVQYVKGNFFRPLTGQLLDIDDANRRLQAWVLQTAGTRTHGTCGWQPLVEFEAAERAAMLPLPDKPYRQIAWKEAKVHSDSHFIFERRSYPVPWRFIGKKVWLRALGASVEVYVDDERIITHERGVDVPDALLDRCLPKERVDYRHRDRGFWEQRADAIDPEVGRYIRLVFDSDSELSMLRPVQSMVSMLEKHPHCRAVAACQRADFYGAYGYRALRDILAKGLDQQPLPVALCPAQGRLDNPRYARTAAELLRLPLESHDECH